MLRNVLSGMACGIFAMCCTAHVQAADLTFSGQIDLITDDEGGGTFSGTLPGASASGVIDDQTISGSITIDSTTVSFGCCIAAGGLEITNDDALDSERAALLTLLTGSLFSAGDVVDTIQIEGDTATLSGGRFEAGMSFILEGDTFNDTSSTNYPPNPADVLVAIFFVLEEDSAGDDIHAAVGLADDWSVSTTGPAVFSSVLPSSRSVTTTGSATFFATIVNSGTTDANACSIAPSTSVDASFFYQETDPATNALVGTRDTPVDIPAGNFQTFLFAFEPNSEFAPTELELLFDCANTDPAPVTTGLNTILLASSTVAVPDVVALAATTSGNGIVTAAPSGVFSVASVNVGATGDVEVSADTGTASLSIGILLCETDPTSGACINPVAPSAAPVLTTIDAGETPTFGIFVSSTSSVPFDPGANRVFVRFKDGGGATRGSTSVAVTAP